MKFDLYHGDCLEVMKDIPDGSIDLILTSPPYDDMRSYERESRSFDFKNIASRLSDKISDGGVMIWNVNDQTVGGSETGTSFRHALYFIDECGLNLHDTMIWQKSNFSNPSTNRYHQVFEYVFVFSRGKPKTFNPIKDRPNISAGKVGCFGNNTVTQRDGSKKTRAKKINSDFGMRHNVWTTNTAGQEQTAKRYKHPAMFSEEFARDHIISWSNKGDTIMDPFMGSGTTGAESIKLKRNFVGIEINQNYMNIARDRIRNICSNDE